MTFQMAANMLKFMKRTVADPGFPIGGSPTSWGEGCANLLFGKFWLELRGNERN